MSAALTSACFTDYNGQDRQKIELVSTAANIMSRYTSFVGVDRNRKEKVKGKAKKVDIPLAASNVSSHFRLCILLIINLKAIL